MSFLLSCIIRHLDESLFIHCYHYCLLTSFLEWGLVLIPFDFDFLTLSPCHPVTRSSHLPLSLPQSIRGFGWVGGGSAQGPVQSVVGGLRVVFMWCRGRSQECKAIILLLSKLCHSSLLLLLRLLLSSNTASVLPVGPCLAPGGKYSPFSSIVLFLGVLGFWGDRKSVV